MTNAQSKPKNEAAERIQTHVKAFPPPIPFSKSKAASQKANKEDYVKFKVKLSQDANSEQTERAVLSFEDGDAEVWCEFRRQLDDLVKLMPLDTTTKKE